MIDDLDNALRRLASSSTHPGLENIGDAVFARIAAQPAERTAARGIAVLTAVVAALMGAASVGLSATTAQATPSLAPFGTDLLAPSTLLGADR